jgi:ssDNA-binding Zn-finger/Zn-ribbon topoisomerase 1
MNITTDTWRLTIQPELENEVRICPDCGSDWVLTRQNRNWFLAKQLSPPRRCERCRAARKLQARTA